VHFVVHVNAGSENHAINFINDKQFGMVEIHHMVLQEDTTADTGK
jgi:hypothetical protein